MSKRISLKDFIEGNNLNPETNNPMEWYRPTEFFLVDDLKLNHCHIFIFSDSTGEMLYLIDYIDAPHSILYTSVEFDEMSGDNKVSKD